LSNDIIARKIERHTDVNRLQCLAIEWRGLQKCCWPALNFTIGDIGKSDVKDFFEHALDRCEGFAVGLEHVVAADLRTELQHKGILIRTDTEAAALGFLRKPEHRRGHIVRKER
jgi:hypothetical protein